MMRIQQNRYHPPISQVKFKPVLQTVHTLVPPVTKSQKAGFQDIVSLRELTDDHNFLMQLLDQDWPGAVYSDPNIVAGTVPGQRRRDGMGLREVQEEMPSQRMISEHMQESLGIEHARSIMAEDAGREILSEEFELDYGIYLRGSAKQTVDRSSPSDMPVGAPLPIESVLIEHHWELIGFEEMVCNFMYPNFFDIWLMEMSLTHELPKKKLAFSVKVLDQGVRKTICEMRIFDKDETVKSATIVYDEIKLIADLKDHLGREDRVFFKVDEQHHLRSISGMLTETPFLFKVLQRNPGQGHVEAFKIGEWTADFVQNHRNLASGSWVNRRTHERMPYESTYGLYKNAARSILVNRKTQIGPYRIDMHAIHFHEELMPFLCTGVIEA